MSLQKKKLKIRSFRMCELDFKILIFFNLKKKLLRLPIYFAHVIAYISNNNF